MKLKLLEGRTVLMFLKHLQYNNNNYNIFLCIIIIIIVVVVIVCINCQE